MMQLGKRTIGSKAPAFVVAEMSGNHNGDINRALAIIDAAAEAGADAVKLQTYTADSITLHSDRPEFMVMWQGKKHSLYDLYVTAGTPWEWHGKLFERIRAHGMIPFSAPFDETAVDFLEKEVDMPCYKIASYEVVHIPLIKKIARTGKPVIMSIGFASSEETEHAVNTLRENGSNELALLHCVTSYSLEPILSEMNLAMIENIREHFGTVVGFSDNNAGVFVPVIAAVVFGASIIEKHLILSRAEGGPDSGFSLEPSEFADMVERIREGEKFGIDAALKGIGTRADIERARGGIHYGPASSREAKNMSSRPSVWAKAPIKKGDEFTIKNIRVARPAYGLSPRYFEGVLGTHATRDIEFAEPLAWDMIEGKQPEEALHV